MKSRNKLITAAIIAMMSSAMFTSCEDECVDCKNNMRVDAVYSTSDATQTPVKAVKFDDAIIIYGDGLSSVNRVSVYQGDVEKFLTLNPTNVTNSAIIVKLEDIETESIDGIKLYSRTNPDQPFVYEIKGYPDPIVNAFYCEFVPNGQVLKIGGNYLYGEPNSTLTAVTYDADGNTINAEVKSSDGKVMEIVLPAGTADGSVVTVTSASGSSVTSKCKIRDKSQVFLNFDDLTNQLGRRGAIDYETKEYNSNIKPTFNGVKNIPVISGNFAALANHSGWDWQDWNTLSFDMASTNREGWDENKNLLDLTNSSPEYNYENNDYLLKFEVYVPEEKPLTEEFIIAFSEYGADSGDGTHYNGETFYCWNYLAGGDPDALPNGNLAFAPYTVKISQEPNDKGMPNREPSKGFTTNGWRTVAIPLTKDYFHYAAMISGMWNVPGGCSSEGKLEAKDFANMWIFPNPNSGNYTDGSSVNTSDYFIAFDNFRIEKGTGCGLVLGQYGTGTVDGTPSGIDYFK